MFSPIIPNILKNNPHWLFKINQSANLEVINQNAPILFELNGYSSSFVENMFPLAMFYGVSIILFALIKLIPFKSIYLEKIKPNLFKNYLYLILFLTAPELFMLLLL